MALKEQGRSAGSFDPSSAEDLSAGAENPLVDRSLSVQKRFRPETPNTDPKSERLWFTGAARGGLPLIPDEHIIEVNFPGRKLGAERAGAPFGSVGIPYGVTADNKYVLMQGSENSSLCTAEAMMFLDVIGKYRLDPGGLRSSLACVQGGLAATFETVAESLGKKLRGTGVEVDYRKYDVSDMAGDCTRNDTILSIFEKLVTDHGSILLGPDRLKEGQVVLLDAVDREGPIPLVRLREPAHGWQITVLGHEFASAIGGSFETIQAYRPNLAPSVEISGRAAHAEKPGPSRQEICIPTRFIDRLTSVGLEDLEPGDLFITSLNGTQRLVLAEEGNATEGRSFTVLVKRKNESIAMQSASLNDQSMAAVLQVVRCLDPLRSRIAGLAPSVAENHDLAIDPVLLANKPEILANAEMLLGMGPQRLTMSSKRRQTTHGTTTVVSVDAILDLGSGVLDQSSYSGLSPNVIPLKVEYGMTAGVKESLPLMRITPLRDGLDPELFHELNCALSIAARFLFTPPELPPGPGDEPRDLLSRMMNQKARR